MLEPRVLVGKCVSKYYTLRVKFSLKLSLTNKQRLLWPFGSPRNILISTKIHDFFKNWAYISYFIRSSRISLRLNWNTLKENKAPIQKFERPNRKIPKSKFFLPSVKNWCPQLSWKLNEAISRKIWIESKQIKTNENQWRFLFFYI